MSSERPAQPLVVVVKGGGDVQPVLIPGGPTLLIVRPKAASWLGVILLMLAVLVLLGVVVAAIVVPLYMQAQSSELAWEPVEPQERDWGENEPMREYDGRSAYQRAIDDAKWSEAESALGALKTSADTYTSQYGYVALDQIEIPAAPIETSGRAWLSLKFDTDSFTDMAYWDAQAFSFSTPGLRQYTIIVNTTNLGTAGHPPSAPGGITIIVNSIGATWIRQGSAQ